MDRDSAHVDTFARDRLPPRELWPELVHPLAELRCPSRFNCAGELLRHAHGGPAGERPAIFEDDRVWTHRELAEHVHRIARVLVEDLGLVPGNRVLIRGLNRASTAACWLAVVEAGGIAVPTMPLLRAKELGDIVDKARIGHALCDVRLRDELEAVRRTSATLSHVIGFGPGEPDELERLAAAKPPTFTPVDTAADDVCLIAFTSGTTGTPKATMHFHRDVRSVCTSFPRAILGTTPEDRFCGTPPLAFTFGLGGLLLFPLDAGAATVLVERTSPRDLLATLERFRATVCFTAPTAYRAMAANAADHDLSSLRACVSAGEPLAPDTRDRWRAATGLEIVDGLGTTEMLHIFASADAAHQRPGSVGRAIPGYTIAVLDEHGAEVPAGTLGRLAVKGPTGCRYLDDPRQAEYVQHGWNVTGDAVVADADGYLHYQARTDDMIVSAGYNIAGPEVEAALALHPTVAECACVGVPDPERGQVVKAFVVVRAGHAADAALARTLQDFVKQRIAPYKYPRLLEFVEALPRTETGKLKRHRLREDRRP